VHSCEHREKLFPIIML